ncbi:MAG TPA: riboflavin kinase [Acidimicrobiales bacterium]|nr:riboflavin kinase [Acidimicrobiales bacterium]
MGDGDPPGGGSVDNEGGGRSGGRASSGPASDGPASDGPASSGPASGRPSTLDTAGPAHRGAQLRSIVRGVVIAGDRRGHLLGFPTANLRPVEGEPLPEDGVYAGVVELTDGSSHLAAISIGCRPQFYAEDGVRLVESYLLDYDADLYGQEIEVRVGERVRGQMRFSSTDELVAQMGRDVDAVRELASLPAEARHAGGVA